ncbi:MAG: hypothetical protein WD904_10840 [Dehalococcoidia bacterium]
MTESSAALTDREFMDALLDLVIPPNASGSLPGAGALGLSPGVALALQADPLLGPIVEAGLQAVRAAARSQHPGGLPGMTPEAGTKLVEAQLSAHPFFMMGLLRYVYPAYYQHPQALIGIGEPPRPPFPEGFDVEPTGAALLEKLQSRRRAG